MGGRPLTRLKRLVEQATGAVARGEKEAAITLLKEAEHYARKAGVDLPAMPADIGEVWMQVRMQAAEKPQRSGETRMSDDARADLLAAGELAAQRLYDLMRDDDLWTAGSVRVLPVAVQAQLIEKTLSKAYGAMVTGAQRLDVPVEKGEERGEVGTVLNMLVRQRAAPADRMRVIEHDEGDDG